MSDNTETNPDIDAKIREAVEAATAGLKAKNSELLGKLKESSETLKRYDGIDPDAVRTILSRFAEDEEGKLIAAGKIDEVLSKRTDRMKAEYERKLGDAAKAAEAERERSKRFEGRVLDDALRAAAAKAGLHQHAIEDALFRGRAMFRLDAEGNAVQLGDDGAPVFGKDGKTPFSPSEWLEGMKDKAPHWFPSSGSGGGAQQSSSTAGKKTYTRAQFNAMSANEQASIARAARAGTAAITD